MLRQACADAGEGSSSSSSSKRSSGSRKTGRRVSCTEGGEEELEEVAMLPVLFVDVVLPVQNGLVKEISRRDRVSEKEEEEEGRT